MIGTFIISDIIALISIVLFYFGYCHDDFEPLALKFGIPIAICAIILYIISMYYTLMPIMM